MSKSNDILIKGDSVCIKSGSIEKHYTVQQLLSDVGVYSNVYLTTGKNNKKYVIKILREGKDFNKYKEILYPIQILW